MVHSLNYFTKLNWRLLSAMSVCLFSLSNCNKNDVNEHTVPYKEVNIELQLTFAQYSDLNSVGGWVYITGGSQGIIVYRNATDEFSAYDRHAPYNTAENCRVRVDSSSVLVVDDCSGSQWLINTGEVIQGPATYPLLEYQTTYTGSSLIIFN